MTFVELQPDIAARDKLKHCPPVELHVMPPNDYNSFIPLKQDPCMPLNLFSETKAVHTSQTKVDLSYSKNLMRSKTKVDLSYNKNLMRSKTKVDLSYNKNLVRSKTKVDLSFSKNLKPAVFNALKFANKVPSLQN